MPLYTVSTREALDGDVKAKLAMMITDVHCAHTGAPRTFVQVYFAQNLPLAEAVDLNVQASVRAGRSEELNKQVEVDLMQQVADLSGISLNHMSFSLFEVPASWVMEGGVILPEPGEEAEWLEKHGHAG
ncbi:MAG: hypothetical protein OIF51_01290 [Cellvibrionaceae bacterium]|nr:hypothetical protein [Cellvibrionaceae bacterium]